MTNPSRQVRRAQERAEIRSLISKADRRKLFRLPAAKKRALRAALRNARTSMASR